MAAASIKNYLRPIFFFEVENVCNDKTKNSRKCEIKKFPLLHSKMFFWKIVQQCMKLSGRQTTNLKEFNEVQKIYKRECHSPVIN